MQLSSGRAVFSPSDLNHFLECEHLIQLELRRGDAPRAPRDAHAELLAAKGIDHERAWLERFRQQGLHIVTIGRDGERDWERDAAETVAAMRQGVDVIYQGVFVDDLRPAGGQQEAVGWRGISDFLVRTGALPGRPGRGDVTPGVPAYEAWDTKLARSSKPYFVLQLCFYTEQIGRLLGRDPEQMHIVLGTGEASSFHYADFAAYYRSVRRRFVAAALAGLPTYPYPVSHCALCDHTRACQARWHADDHLSQVAGITREQVERLHVAGVRTIAHLAETPGAISDPRSPIARPRIGDATLARLRHQARLQAGHRDTGTHRYELLPVDERTGFRLLPQASAGDIFFDMEGDPFFEPASGLEYLFGAQTADGFTYFQALTRAEEKAAFEQFIDWVHMRLREWPDLHVYHYAPYEVTALKRLMSSHATREDEVDDLLRREIFVDLYQVVRQSLRISHDSYSIKRVRTFFMEGAGRGIVADGGDSILQFEQFRTSGDPALLQSIIDYNREDCVSTVELRNWLLGRKLEAEASAGVSIPWKTVDASPDNPKRVEEDAQTGRRADALRTASCSEAAVSQAGAELLAHLLGYHRREAKPEWWAYFDRMKKGLDDLLDDTQAIAWLEQVAGVEPRTEKLSLVHTLGFPDQEFKLEAESRIIDPFSGRSPGSLERVDPAALRLELKRGKKRTEPLPAAICAGAPLDDGAQRLALGRIADAVTTAAAAGRRVERYGAVLGILDHERPRLAGVGASVSRTIQTLDLEVQKSLVAALDDSHLLIQGPPGSGKTWTGARLIVSLLADGRKIGVAANSHKAINNLLREVEAVATAEGVAFEGFKKGSGSDGFGGRMIADTDDNAAIELAVARDRQPGGAAAHSPSLGLLVAGTSWLFSREQIERSLDYLFIDEAGQVALADVLAMGTSARNLVLLGDPQQLPQVRQGIHPGGAGCSVLEHLLQGSATVAEDRGIFLARSWRMHPDVCGFISQLSYDGRLESAAGRERQRIDAAERLPGNSNPGPLTGAGLRYVPVEHAGNSQQSPEEAAAIASHVERLLDGGTFTDHEGRRTPLRPEDILVVAPYNMQVRCLREALPPGVEVGTVDKFQGREAPVVFFSMASSTGEDVPRGLEFLFNRNRFNVAISRAKALAIVVSSPRLMDVRCRTVEQMRLANMLCSYVERCN